MKLTKSRHREGTVVVAVAVSLVAMLGAIALSLDGGLCLEKRRNAQGASDAAALAAASELYKSWFANKGLDNGPLPGRTGPAAGAIKKLAKDVAAANGYQDGVNGVTVEVFIPPVTGPFKGRNGHAEVKIACSQKRFFSTVFGSRSNVPIGTRAVARGMSTSVNNGIIVLNPTLKGSFSNGGGGNVTVGGSAGVIVDSNNPEAMIANGGGTVSAPYYDVTGVSGYATPGGGSFTGTINSGVDPTPDPLRFVPPPDPSTLITRSTKKISHSSASTLTLQPGLYIGGISITGKGNVVLKGPGIYYMQGGGFSMTGQGSLTGLNVLIYNDPKANSDTINLAGQGAITLTAMADGPYQGILIFQRRDGLPQPDVSVSGSGTAPMSITGTFYAPAALLSVTGNGTQDTIGSQYISDTLKLGGNGTFNVDWNPALVPGVRQVWLVE